MRRGCKGHAMDEQHDQASDYSNFVQNAVHKTVTAKRRDANAIVFAMQ